MSRIYEALRNAQESRSKSGLADSDALGAMELLGLRIGPRQEWDRDLTVYGHSPSGAPFYEQARAVTANVNGGSFLLGVPVTEGQDLLLINSRTSQEQICRVVHLLLRDEQPNIVSIAFPESNSEFWHILGADEQD